MKHLPLLLVCCVLSACGGGLAASARKNDLPAVQAALAQGALPRAATEALCVAVQEGHLQAVKALWPAADRSREGNRWCRCSPDPYREASPLICAVLHDRPEIAAALLDLGADVNAPLGAYTCPDGRPAGWTPLAVAARRNRAVVARLLLSRGADKSAKSVDHTRLPMSCKTEGWTALAWARDRRSHDVVDALADVPAQAAAAPAVVSVSPAPAAAPAASSGLTIEPVAADPVLGEKLELALFRAGVPVRAGGDAVLRVTGALRFSLVRGGKEIWSSERVAPKDEAGRAELARLVAADVAAALKR